MELCSLSAANGRGLCRRARGGPSGIVECGAAVLGCALIAFRAGLDGVLGCALMRFEVRLARRQG